MLIKLLVIEGTYSMSVILALLPSFLTTSMFPLPVDVTCLPSANLITFLSDSSNLVNRFFINSHLVTASWIQVPHIGLFIIQLSIFYEYHIIRVTSSRRCILNFITIFCSWFIISSTISSIMTKSLRVITLHLLHVNFLPQILVAYDFLGWIRVIL